MQNTTKDISFVIFLFNKYSHMYASDMTMFPLYDDTGKILSVWFAYTHTYIYIYSVTGT